MPEELNYKRHRRAYSIYYKLLHRIIAWKFNIECDDISNIQGPYLLMANHTTNYDPILVGLMTKGLIYYVASEHIMHNKLAYRFLHHSFDPIIHQKGKKGINTIKEMMCRFKKGFNVCLFPEGNRTFNGITMDIPEVNGKIAKTCGVAMVTVRFSGGYFTQPRWGRSLRRTKMKSQLVNIYKPEQLKTMKPEEITACIKRDLYENAYDSKPEEVYIQGRNLAEGLETTLFMCPLCQSIGSLSSRGNHITCSCGYDAVMERNGRLYHSDREYTIPELDSLQKKELEVLYIKYDTLKPAFQDSVNISFYEKAGTVSKTRHGILKAYRDYYEFENTRIEMQEIGGLAIHSGATLIVMYGKDGIHLEITGDKSFSGLKYIYWYELQKRYFEGQGLSS